MEQKIRIGTRDSQLALWQATLVQQQLASLGQPSELVHIKSEGDIDLVTPLYAIGVQGVFTRTLDAALLSGRIDLAVHSMKDVPVQLAKGLSAAAILPRANFADLLVLGGDAGFLDDPDGVATIATSSLRRKAQWLHRYPYHHIENLRGNVNTRMAKVAASDWQGAIFAAAGLERIGLRPETAVELDWMLPAPAQGAILVACRTDDAVTRSFCAPLHDAVTAACVDAERAFLSALLGGCSTPIGALAEPIAGGIRFRGNVCALDGNQCLTVDRTVSVDDLQSEARDAAEELLSAGAGRLIQKMS